MTLRAQQFLLGVTSGDHSEAFAFKSWLETRYILNDDTIMQYLRGDHIHDHISLLALDCDDFCAYMSALHNELETSKDCRRMAQNGFYARVASIGRRLIVGFSYWKLMVLFFDLLCQMTNTLSVVGWR